MLDPRAQRISKVYYKLVELSAMCDNMFKFRPLNSAYTMYEIEFDGIEGLYAVGKLIKKRTAHKVVLSLPAEFPVKIPKLNMVTGVFHPNIAVNGVVCLGTRWTPMTGIDKIIVELANMIQLKSYNLDNPYNEDAREWVLRNKSSISRIVKQTKFPPTSDELEILGREKDDLEIVE